MNLKSMIEKKDDAAKYMQKEIEYIIKNFEKRGPGSKGEKQACDYMADTLKNECGCETVFTESFKENPGSFFGWIFFTISFALASIPLYFVFPLASVILVAIGFAIMFFQFGLYRKVVDRFFPEMTGHNVTAIKKCKGEVKRRIFFNGHPDACWEWPVNYALGGIAFDMHLILAILGALYYMILAIVNVCINGIEFGIIDTSSDLFKAGLGGLFFVPFLIGR